MTRLVHALLLSALLGSVSNLACASHAPGPSTTTVPIVVPPASQPASQPTAINCGDNKTLRMVIFLMLPVQTALAQDDFDKVRETLSNYAVNAGPSNVICAVAAVAEDLQFLKDQPPEGLPPAEELMLDTAKRVLAHVPPTRW